MARPRSRNRQNTRYGYEGPSRRRRLRRIIRVLRVGLGVSTALVGGAFLRQAVEGLPSGNPANATAIWLIATALATVAVVLLISMAGWGLEWYYATHPPAATKTETALEAVGGDSDSARPTERGSGTSQNSP